MKITMKRMMEIKEGKRHIPKDSERLVPIMDCGTCEEWGIEVKKRERIDVEPKLMEKLLKLYRIEDFCERNEALMATLSFNELQLYVKLFESSVKVYYVIDFIHFYTIESEIMTCPEYYKLIDDEEKYLKKNHILFITDRYSEAVDKIIKLNKKNFRYVNGVRYTREHLIEMKYFDSTIMKVFEDEVMYFEEDEYEI